MGCEFQINTRSPPPPPLQISFFSQEAPKNYEQRVSQRRLGLGCVLHFPHSGQTAGFPVAGICSSASQNVRDRTNSSMTRALFKSNDRYPLPPLVRAPWLLPTGALRRDCIKKDHFKETRCAPRLATKMQKLPELVKSVSLRLGPGFFSTDTHRGAILYDLFCLAFGALSPGSFPLRLLRTPRRQSELQPDWRQTRRGETAHRSPALQQLAVEGGAQNAERSPGRGVDRIPNANHDSPQRLTANVQNPYLVCSD